MPVVSLVKFEDPPVESVTRALHLAGAAGCVARGASVLVKPNLHGGPGYTSPILVEAVCRWAFDQGAARVYAGDGPFWACSSDEAREYFAGAGLHAACEATGAEPVNLHEHPYRTIRPDDPDMPEEIGLSELLFGCDTVINVPLLKTHMNTLVTLGLKNMKGCMRPKDKKRFHELELADALAGMAQVVAPHISVNILDATTAVEGMGPAAGTDVEMGLIAASTDLIALDSVGCDLAGIHPSEVRVMRKAAARGVGEMDLTRIDVVGEKVQDHRRRFRRPFEEVVANFPRLRIEAEAACSGCAMNLFQALASIADSDDEVRVPAVAIGTGARIEEGLAVGNCAKTSGGQPLVKGCPPRPHEIRSGLTAD